MPFFNLQKLPTLRQCVLGAHLNRQVDSEPGEDDRQRRGEVQNGQVLTNAGTGTLQH